MKRILLLILSLTIISCQPPQKEEKSAETPFKEFTQLIDQYAQETLEKGHINSIALAVYKDGEIYQNYYGEIDKGIKNPPNNHTLYEVASISKVFAGSLAARAVVDQKINLDDDIRKYLEGEYPNLEYESTPISIKNLLTHTLGFPNKNLKTLSKVYKKVAQGHYEKKSFDYNFNDFLKELKTVKLEKKPGTFYQYNSFGPDLIAHILEKVYNKPYKELLMDFFNELDMKNTHLQDYSNHQDHLSNSYDSAGNLAPLDKNPLLGGGYGIITPLPDLINLMKFQLESNDPLIREATQILFEDDDDNTMGYLWQDLGTGEEEGFYYSKTGTSNGVQSGVLICPDSNYGLILIVNNKSEESLNDWGNLFFSKMEADLIKYPKINLVSLLKKDFINNTQKARQQYQALKKQSNTYFSGANMLNQLGYELLLGKNTSKAIEVFEFATQEHPQNANLFDSLGEAYFYDKNYEKSALNFKKSIVLNPNNNNAKKYLTKIESLKSNM